MESKGGFGKPQDIDKLEMQANKYKSMDKFFSRNTNEDEVDIGFTGVNILD